MTRQEAIEILTETQVVYFAPNGKAKVQEALDMAIEALSAEAVDLVQCGDCIWYDGRSEVCNRSGGLTMYPLHEYDFCSYIERREP